MLLYCEQIIFTSMSWDGVNNSDLGQVADRNLTSAVFEVQ